MLDSNQHSLRIPSAFFKGQFIVLVLILDQLSKFWAQSWGWSNINPGISFGIAAQVVGQPLGLWILSLIVVFLVGWYFFRRTKLVAPPFLIELFLGGAISNLIDRWIWGGVVDWLPIPFLPIFNNLADWALSLSLLGIMLVEFGFIKSSKAIET